MALLKPSFASWVAVGFLSALFFFASRRVVTAAAPPPPRVVGGPAAMWRDATRSRWALIGGLTLIVGLILLAYWLAEP